MKSLLITDLDNTLFDWFEVWYHSFDAMLREIERISGIQRKELIPEIREIHQRHGTSEYAFLIEEIPALRRLHGEGSFLTEYQSALDAYRTERRKHLSLYPTVRETLQALKGKGVTLAGYTESMAYYTNYRVRRLKLDKLLDYLYSPRDHDLPSGLTREEIRYYPESHYDFEHTEHRYTPEGELKPNPHILLSIIDELGFAPGDAVYVGDSLFKDIAMAKDAGVADVYAKYGPAHERIEYDLLREVTHWTNEDVECEQALKERNVEPSLVLENSFSELLTSFEFGARGRE